MMDGVHHVFKARFEEPAVARILGSLEHGVYRGVKFDAGAIRIATLVKFPAVLESFFRLLYQKVG